MWMLMADDNPINCKIFARMTERALAKLGLTMQLDSAINGEKALELWRENGDSAYDMVLLDHDMPVMDGKECTKLMRAEGSVLPIVGITARMDQDKPWFDVGLTDVMRKPFAQANFMKIVTNHFCKDGSLEGTSSGTSSTKATLQKKKKIKKKNKKTEKKKKEEEEEVVTTPSPGCNGLAV